MLKATIEIAAVLAIVAFFAGCAGPEGNSPFREETLLDRNWGRSVETAKYSQILDPEAGKNASPVEGLGGNPAGYTIEKYENSFKEKIKVDIPSTTAVIK
jgi:hypothetical protein